MIVFLLVDESVIKPGDGRKPGEKVTKVASTSVRCHLALAFLLLLVGGVLTGCDQLGISPYWGKGDWCRG